MGDKFKDEFGETIEDERAGFVHSELSKLREISLHSGTSSTSGILYVDGYPVCWDSSKNTTGEVACKTLGFIGLKKQSRHSFDGETTFSMSKVNCDGNEFSLFECRHEMFGDCTSGGIYIECSDEEFTSTEATPASTFTSTSTVKL